MVLPEEYFGAFPYSAIPGFTMDTVHASVAGAFGYFFTYFCVKVDLVSRGQFSLPRALMVVFRPEMPRILVGMTRRTVTWRESGSVMCNALFCWCFCTSRCIPPVVLKPMMPCIMAGMDQRDSYLVRVWLWHVQCLFRWCFCISSCIPPVVLKPMTPRIMAGMDQRDSYLVRVWQWHVQCWVFLVFLHFALCSLLCLQAQDARLHGRHGPQDRWRFTGAVLGQGFLHARCCATCGATVQTVQYTVWRFRSCSSSRSSHPRRGAEAFPMAQTVLQTIEIPLLPFRRLCCAGSASSSVAGVEKTAVSHIALRGCRRGAHV